MKSVLNRNSVAIFIAILFTGQTNFSSAILPKLYEAFPALDPNIIMLFYTLPLLVNGSVGLALGPVIKRINKKALIVGGLSLIGISGGLISFLGANSFAIALAGVVLLSIGVSSVTNASNVLLSIANPEKTGVLTSMNNAIMAGGVMLCSAVGGILAEQEWTRMYWLCFPALVSLLLFLFLYRDEKEAVFAPQIVTTHKVDTAPTISPYRLGTFAMIFITFICSMINQAAYLSNYSNYVIVEKAFGTTTETGLMASIGALGSLIGGLFLVGVLLPRLKNWAIPIGLIFMLLPNLAVVLGSVSWPLLAALTSINAIGLQLVYGTLAGAGNKTIGPAGLTGITAAMSLGNFVGPYIINFLSEPFTEFGQIKFLFGVIFALIGIIISIPTMHKVERLQSACR